MAKSHEYRRRIENTRYEVYHQAKEDIERRLSEGKAHYYAEKSTDKLSIKGYGPHPVPFRWVTKDSDGQTVVRMQNSVSFPLSEVADVESMLTVLAATETKGTKL